jgi:hypothetical protein
MNVFDFITLDEIEDLPDDDPQSAFTSFVRIAQRRLAERTKGVDPDQDWMTIEDARHGFMNVVIAAAKRYEIEPFATMTIPRLKDFNRDDHRQFQSDLDHYMTQLLLDNSARARRDSVFISPQLKSAIRTYVHHLREKIEGAEDISDSQRDVLLRKLTEFEAELEKKRLNLLSVAMITLTFLGAPGALASSADMAARLVTNILRVVDEAKKADDEMRRLPSAEPTRAITGPRGDFDDLGETFKEPSRNVRKSMDDEIPF